LTSKISVRYEMQGLTEDKVELEHLRTIVKEMDREIRVMESVRSDNKLLREQLSRQEDKYRSLEATRSDLEKTRVE